MIDEGHVNSHREWLILVRAARYASVESVLEACLLRTLREAAMPLFIIERNFAERLELTRDETLKTLDVNDDLGLRWLYSFLSADKRKTYCLYEAPNAQALREHAQRLGIPADSIIEVSQIQPEILVQT